jgi:hypothetical protein
VERDARLIVSPFSIRLPDHPRWWEEPGHDPEVADVLARAYIHLLRGGTNLQSYRDAYIEAESLAGRSMSMRQRIRRCYILSKAYGAVGDLETALEWVEWGLWFTDRLPPFEEVHDLLYLRGVILRGLMQVHDAAADFRECLGILHERRAGAATANPSEVSLELDALGLLANAEFFLANYDMAQRLIDEGRATALLLPDSPTRQQQIALFDWFQAYLWRWQGQPERALGPAASAAAVYDLTGMQGSAARIHTLTAEIALDRAEQVPEGSARERMLRIARPHIMQAIDFTREPHDDAGRALVWITRARYSRLWRRDHDRFTWLDGVLRTAKRTDDKVNLVQGHIGVADELVASGDPEAALFRYRDVLQILTGSETPALVVPALAAIARLRPG